MPGSAASVKRNRMVAAIAAAVVVLSATAAGVLIVTRGSTQASELGVLDACDPAGLVPCEQQAACLSLPIADTGLSLTYSSQWAAGRKDRPDWDAGSLGLATSLPPTSRTSANRGTGSTSTLTLGTTISGSISSPSHHDDYTFTATAGEVVYLQAQGTCVSGLNWALLQPGGATQDFNPTCHDMGREVLTNAGVWTVRVNWSNATTGGYAFKVFAVPSPTTNPLTLGQPVSGSIDRIGLWDNYTFAATPGGIVYLQAKGACVNGLEWALLQPGGATQDFNPTCRDVGREVLTTAGMWTVWVYSQVTATGSFAFVVLPVPAPTSTSLSLGQNVTGSVDQVGQWIDYTFTATAGEIVYLQAQAACGGGLNWALLRPDGSTRDFNSACHDIGREVLTTAGVWTVQVYSSGTAIGAYAFTVRAST